jgi:hypothetical protein
MLNTVIADLQKSKYGGTRAPVTPGVSYCKLLVVNHDFDQISSSLALNIFPFFAWLS